MILCNEKVVLSLISQASQLTSLGDSLNIAKASGDFDKMESAEQSKMIEKSLSIRIVKMLDEMQDLKQCTRAEAGDWIAQKIMWSVWSHANR
jgi:hypothetical protein